MFACSVGHYLGYKAMRGDQPPSSRLGDVEVELDLCLVTGVRVSATYG
jgi:hypothetical protein